MAIYQHNDEVIELARLLRQEIIDDSPYGNSEIAEGWFQENYSQIEALANQPTEEEDEGSDP